MLEFVVSQEQPQQSFTNEPPGCGSDRWKPNATSGLLRLKMCRIDREVTPFQALSVKRWLKNGNAIALCSRRLRIIIQFKFECL